jgi:hypothetical protein
MRYFTLLFCLLSFATYDNIAQSNTQKVTDLFKGIINFDGSQINEERPIPTLNLLAAQQADTLFFLNKNNVSSVMKEAKKYKSCIISVDRHTIVLVTSWENSSKSGSWNYYLPYGIGFIQRENLAKKEDFVKNIIGIPDSQRRTVFLFNKK